MEPDFKSGEKVLVNRFAYLFSDPLPGEVVAFEDPRERGKILLKRIDKQRNSKYFMIGINEKSSRDSRRFGMVGKNKILGKVLLRY